MGKLLLLASTFAVLVIFLHFQCEATDDKAIDAEINEIERRAVAPAAELDEEERDNDDLANVDNQAVNERLIRQREKRAYGRGRRSRFLSSSEDIRNRLTIK